MKSDEVTAWVEERNESDASSLFNEKLPKMGGRLTRATNTLKKILEEIKEEFPDAEYYTASGGFNLLLGQAHDDQYQPHQERCAWGSSGFLISDGDF